MSKAATKFRRSGRLQIKDFLAESSAVYLREELRRSTVWRRLVNGSSTVFETPADTFDQIDPHIRATLDEAIFANAAWGFQYSYDSIRVPDATTEQLCSEDALISFARFMNSATVSRLLKTICGDASINFTDVQATRYRPGDFLTRHDDQVEGKNRSAAYVLGLMEQWRAEWGGLLTFLTADGAVAETFVPGFNVLHLFAVGQPHFVSPVAPYTPAPRLSITGWLRRID